MVLQLPNGFSATQKSPKFAVGVEFGSNAQAIGGAKKILLLGNKTSSGTIAAATPTQAYSLSDARSKAGNRSELAAMCERIFAQRRNANVTLCAVAENGSGVQATGTLLFAGPATSGGVVRLWVRGRMMPEVTVTSGDTASTIAAAVNAVAAQQTYWPVTSGVSTATVTLTAAQKGPKANQIAVRAEVTATGVTIALNGGTAAASVSGRMGTGTATAGSGADDIANALAAVAGSKYDLIVCSSSDSTNAGKLSTHLTTLAAISTQIRQQGVIASYDTLSNAKTLTSGLNQILISAAWAYNSEEPEAEVAAAYAAALLYGDGQIGGKSTGLEADCAANMNGTQIADILVPYVEADRPIPTEIEDALNNGLTPLVPSAFSPGYLQISRAITTAFKDSSSNPEYSRMDVGIPTTLFELADRIELMFATQYQNKKLAPDPSDLRGPSATNVVFPYMIRRSMLDVLFAMENEGKLINVDALASQVIAEQSNLTPTLLVCQVPASVIPILNAAAVRLLQDTQLFLPVAA